MNIPHKNTDIKLGTPAHLVDPVQIALEEPASARGDLISDDYARSVDLSTAPHRSSLEDRQLHESLDRLGEPQNTKTAEHILGKAGLHGAFTDTIEQVRDIVEE